jgi:hypothetical protein
MKYLILALLLVSQVEASVINVAKFTGNYEKLPSVNRVMYNCEYVFSGKHYWRKFENACEPMIFIDKEG